MLLGVAVRHAAAAFTGATLASSYVQYGVTLSNGNLTLQTYDGGGAAYVGSTSGKNAATANIYWEVHADSVGASTADLCGIAIAGYTSGAPGGSYDGSTPHAYGFAPNGTILANQSSIATVGTYATGDTIKFLLKNGKFYVGKVGVGWYNSGDPVAETGYVVGGLTSNWVPGAGSGGPLTYQWTYNFGATAWADTPPSGATGWAA